MVVKVKFKIDSKALALKVDAWPPRKLLDDVNLFRKWLASQDCPVLHALGRT
jgi:hypothetical protein